MKILSSLGILSLLALTCCGGVVDDAPGTPPTCPVVACAFVQGGCDPAVNTYVEHTTRDDGNGCWAFTAACYPKDTPVGCEPADCFTETSLACGAR